MKDLRFIKRNGEYIVKKPISQSEVPEPPVKPSSNISASNVFKIGLGITVLLLLLGVFLIPNTEDVEAGWYEDTIDWFKELFGMSEEEVINRILEITPSTMKICESHVCTLTFFGGIRHIYEDEVWKKIEEARSLKGSGITCEVISDGSNIAECLDFNYTTRTIKFSTTQDLELTPANIPLRKYSKEFDDKTESIIRVYDNASEIELNFDLNNKDSILIIEANSNDIIEFGEYSTEIIINSSATSLIWDTWVVENTPSGIYYTDADIYVKWVAPDIRSIFLKFNITSIPAGVIIDDAKVGLYSETAPPADRIVTPGMYEIDNQSWVDSVTSWTTRPIEIGAKLGQRNISAIGRYTWNLTTWVQNQSDLGKSNLTVMFKPEYVHLETSAQFSSMDDAIVWKRPFLNVTYFLANNPPIIELHAPINNTMIFYDSMNFTYNVTDIDADPIVNCSIIIDNSTIETDYSITQLINQSINLTSLTEGDHLWIIGCYDDQHEQGNSTAFNLTIDIDTPVVDLQAPINDFTTASRYLNFTYNVTTLLGTIHNCSLWLNNSVTGNFALNETDISITQLVNQTINLTLGDEHFYNWKVECTSNINLKGNSSEYNFTYNNDPTTPTTLSPANNTRIAADNTLLTCSGSTDPEGDTLNYAFFNSTISGALEESQNSTNTTFYMYLTNPANYTYWSCSANDNITTSAKTPERTITKLFFDSNCSRENVTAIHVYNFSFAEEDGTELSDVDFDMTVDYWGSDRNVNLTATYDKTVKTVSSCLTPNSTANTKVNINYEKTGFALRNFLLPNQPINSITQNITLYLLNTTDGIYVTFNVINSASQPLKNVYFTANRTIDGVSLIVYSDLTDDAGTVVPLLDPDISYTFRFDLEGYDVFSTTIKPTQTSYTITLGGVVEEDEFSFSQGIKYNIKPLNGTLSNDTVFTFSFDISSSYWALELAGFNLTDKDGNIIISKSCSAPTGCISSTSQSTYSNETIIMNYFWTIDNNVSKGSIYWLIAPTYTGEYSIAHFFLVDMQRLGAGFNDFSRGVLSFLIIMSILIFAVVRYNINSYSPAATLFLIFALTVILDLVNFMPNIPAAVPYFIPLMMGVIAFGYFIFELRR